MTTGYHVVKAINDMLDEDLKAEFDKSEVAMGKVAGSILEQHQMDLSGRYLARAMRRVRTERADEERVRKFKSAYPSLESYSAEIVLALFEKLGDATRPVGFELAKARTRLSMVASVLKTLTDKWQRTVEPAGEESKWFVMTQKGARDLLNQEIEGASDLRLWLVNTYDFFHRVAVFVGRQDNLALKKPVGMVSENSERAYHRSWNEWTQERAFEIIERAKRLASDGSAFNYAGGYSRSLSELGGDIYGERPSRALRDTINSDFVGAPVNSFSAFDAESPRMAPATASPDHLGKFGIDLRLSSTTSADAVAERSWETAREALAGLDAWINVISNLWGQEGKVVSLSINADIRGKQSSITLPGATPAEVAMAANTYISAVLM